VLVYVDTLTIQVGERKKQWSTLPSDLEESLMDLQIFYGQNQQIFLDKFHHIFLTKQLNSFGFSSVNSTNFGGKLCQILISQN